MCLKIHYFSNLLLCQNLFLFWAMCYVLNGEDITRTRTYILTVPYDLYVILGCGPTLQVSGAFVPYPNLFAFKGLRVDSDSNISMICLGIICTRIRTC